MNCARLVKTQICQTRLQTKLLWQHVGQHHDIGLFENLHLIDFRAGVIEQNRLLARLGFVPGQIDSRFAQERIILRQHAIGLHFRSPQML